MTTHSTLSHDRCGHVVQFYDSDRDLADKVVGFLLAGDVGSAIAIVTPEHRAAIVSMLTTSGMDTEAELNAGLLLLLDAALTLDLFMVGGSPDPAAFEATVGATIRSAGTAGMEVRAYGEMVAVLWEEGNVAGALQLESLWNELGERLSFSLLCGYPSELVRDPGLATDLA